jgi:hypothetical protein
MREILDMVNEDVTKVALGKRPRREQRVDEAAGGVAKKGLNKLAEAGVTAAATAVGGPAGAAAAQGAMKGAKALKAANKIAGTVRDVSKALTPSETTKQKLGGAARTAALVKSLVGTRKIKPEKDERLQAMKEQYKQVAATKPGLTPAEIRQIEGEPEKGFDTFGDPNIVGDRTADLKRTVATQQQQGLDAAKRIKDLTDIRFSDHRERLNRLRGESEGRLDRLEKRKLQRERAADYDRGKALEGYAEHQEKRGKTGEVQAGLKKEAEMRIDRERARALDEDAPRWSQKKTAGMTRKEILGGLGLGDDIPEYVLDMSTEELYKLAREKGLI